jgi:hypothetical protein
MTDLFNNPVFKEKFDSLPKEEQEKYKKAGEYMYNKDVSKIDYNSKMTEAVEYIKIALRSGMMPCHLTTDELAVMRTTGAEWYKEFDFPSESYSGMSVVNHCDLCDDDHIPSCFQCESCSQIHWCERHEICSFCHNTHNDKCEYCCERHKRFV